MDTGTEGNSKDMMLPDRIGQLLKDYASWASSQADILAVALVGSYARQTAKENSDVDLVIVTNRPDLYLKDLGWTRRFGQIERKQIEDYGKLISIRVWYSNGLEVEYGITDESWFALPLDNGTLEVISGGMRVLFERGDVLSGLQTQE